MTAFKNQVVWITGASSGIGEALAYACAKEGSKLVLSARRTSALERVKAACQLPGDQILVVPLDLAEHDAMQTKVEQVMQHFGRIDHLINNAGISQRSLLKDTEFAVFKKLIDVDYLGTVALTKAVLPIFMEQQRGHFSVVTSLMGKFASPLRAGYCGAKHALHGFFDALRMEHHEDQIKVTLICPGFIQTNVSMNALTGDGSPQQTMDQATGKGIPVDRCAQKIIRGIKANRHEVIVARREKIGVYLKRFFPRLLHEFVRKSEVT
ncbi:MAG: SDR family oxidoreductase [Saprospiraceae bacterium]